MTPRRIPFLPAFFLALGLIFAAALFVRLRSYPAADAQAAALPGVEAPAAGARVATATHAVTPAPPVENRTSAAAPIAGSEEPVQPVSRREKLFRELLNAKIEASNKVLTAMGVREPAPPALATPAPPRPTPSAATAPRADRPPRPGQPSAVASNSSAAAQSQQPGQSSGQPGEDPTPRERDNTSDTVPPRVVSVEFQPPSIRDGEETMLSVIAMDDLSGVKNISGSIISPSGGLTGFALQRQGDGQRWVTRIAVPRDAPEGTWHINYLSLTDNASNTTNLNYTQGGAPTFSSFQVSSARPDSTGPTLRGVRLDRPTIRAGERVTLFVDVTDDMSGVNLVSGVFHSPGRLARVGFGCRGVQNTNTWSCDVSAPACLDCGDWQLEQIQMQDKANNMSTARIDNALVAGVRLGIAGDSCDSAPPAMTALTLDQNIVSNVEQTTIVATAVVTDDACGVASVSGQAMGPPIEGGQQPRIFFSFVASGDPATWTARIVVPRLAAKGVWAVTWMQLLDKGNNLKTYSQSDPVLAPAVFRVE